MIIYSKGSGTNNAAIGKLETPIKMVIERESSLLAQKGGICDWLFNVEDSNRFGETIIGQTDFSIFQATPEGDTASQDTMREFGSKFIEHIQYTKEFAISAEMMEDANYGLAADARRRAESFVRAYHRTRNKICELALCHGDSDTLDYAGAEIDLTCMDGKPLFNNSHKYGTNGKQSNFFFGQYTNFGDEDNTKRDPSRFAEVLYSLSHKLRMMKDDNGEVLGYTADTIILPGNNPKLEATVKAVCGSDKAPFSTDNSINLHYGNWNIVVLPNWYSSRDAFMLMSSEANKNLCGNMFFNRVPLTVSNWVDHHTGNYIWNGRCRFGVGFGNYKHILLAIDSTEEIDDATNFEI